MDKLGPQFIIGDMIVQAIYCLKQIDFIRFHRSTGQEKNIVDESSFDQHLEVTICDLKTEGADDTFLCESLHNSNFSKV